MPRNNREIEYCRNALRDQLKLAQNKRCGDCGVKQPTWASTNIGVFVCIRCSGIHRNLGTHISKVKSTTLDSWTYKLLDHFTAQGGNVAVNSRYEAKLPKAIKPSEATDTYTLEQFIRNKYCHRRWYDENASIKTIDSDDSENEKSKSKSNLRKARANGVNVKNGTSKTSKTSGTSGMKQNGIKSINANASSSSLKSTKSSKSMKSNVSSKPKPVTKEKKKEVVDLLNTSELDIFSQTTKTVNGNTSDDLLNFVGLSISNEKNGKISNNGSALLPAENGNWISMNGNGNQMNGGTQPDLLDVSDLDKAKNDILSKFKSNQSSDLMSSSANSVSKHQIPSDFLTQLGGNGGQMNNGTSMNGMNNGMNNNMNNMNNMNMMNNGMNNGMNVNNMNIMNGMNGINGMASGKNLNLSQLYRQQPQSNHFGGMNMSQNGNVFTMFN